jgi:hypothetical protein
MNPWLAHQVAEVVSAAQALHAQGEREVWLQFRRGSVVASGDRRLEGYELVTQLSVPRGKSEVDLTDWVVLQLQKVPCCP